MGSIILCSKRYGRKTLVPLFGEYSLSTKKWKLWQYPKVEALAMVHDEAGYVCTANGRYLISFGGEGYDPLKTYDEFDEGDTTALVWVYDLNDHTRQPMVSDIECPM